MEVRGVSKPKSLVLLGEVLTVVLIEDINNSNKIKIQTTLRIVRQMHRINHLFTCRLPFTD